MDTPLPFILYPDTNVLVQGRALKDLAWSELGRDPIDVILCGPVIRELDRLKTRPGRVGKVARAISTKVRELMRTAERSEILSDTSPRVVLRLATSAPNQSAVREGIDLSHDDQAIINQALARLDVGADVALLTDDNFAAMTAEHFGLPVQLLPGHWLKEPEPDDNARAIAQRDAEIARLKAAEPVLQLRFAEASGADIERLEVVMDRFQPLAASDVNRLVDRVSALAPMAELKPTAKPPRTQHPAAGKGVDIANFAVSALGIVPVTQDEIDEYQERHKTWLVGVRTKIAAFHTEWNDHRDWPHATFYALNSGSRPADDVLVEIMASGSFALSGSREPDDNGRSRRGRSWLKLALPPIVPQPKSRTEMLSALRYLDNGVHREPYMPAVPDLSRLRRNDDEFYWREGKTDPVSTMSLECKSWRHGRDDEDFPFVVWANDTADVRGLIVGRVSAANLGQPLEKHLPVRISFEDRDCLVMATTLVDDFEQRLAARRG